LDGEAIEIRDILEWGGGALIGDHQIGSCGFGGSGFDIRATFFLNFPAADLVAAVDLGSGLLGLAVFLMAVALECLSASMTG